MIKDFKDPPAKFRPLPFWSWNDRLEKNELEYQIQQMKAAGMGGYFMHARSGLKTEYLSDEWFDCIEAGIKKAEQTGLQAWIYDEEGWPSGFAGGRVPELSPDFHCRFMTIEELPQGKAPALEGLIALYSFDGKSYCRLPYETREAPQGRTLLAVYEHSNRFYIDTLCKRAVTAFIDATHERYYARFKSSFGSGMHGFFTDEPRLACNNIGDLPWSLELPKAFMDKYGYDITNHLPALYYGVKGCEKYRYDFWTLVNELFVDSYMKTIYQWCCAHGCKATGHIMMEESIFSQMTSSGGVMPFYEYLHIPGIDWLRRRIESPVIAKQVGSVACQLGKKQVLTESYALCGWDVSFEELKWIAEWQFVNGVNQLCQHLEAYTIKGARKRDYPPSHFTQQTWWPEFSCFTDYMARLCAALSEGDQIADVLLIHPMRSGYVVYDGTRTPEIKLLDEEFARAAETLSSEHISYHFGDETIIKKYGKVTGDTFCVGRVGYRAVVLPHMYAIDGATLELLTAFMDAGGTVIAAGRLPDYTNGDPEELILLASRVKRAPLCGLRQTLLSNGLVSVSISENGAEIPHISYQQRRTESGMLLFIVNHSQTHSCRAEVTVCAGRYAVKRLEAETGDAEAVEFDATGKDTLFALDFAPMQSHIIELTPVCGINGLKKPAEHALELQLPQSWSIDNMELNSMTLDVCRCRVDGGAQTELMPVIKLQSDLLALKRPCEIELEFEFDVRSGLEKNKEFYAVIEDAQLYGVFVNGNAITGEPCGWWKDKSFKKLDIKPYVKTGKNTLVLTTVFSQPKKVYDVLFGENVYETEKNKLTFDMEIESVYLLGDFGVRSLSPFVPGERNSITTNGPFVITEPPQELSGSFAQNGLLFFAGVLDISGKLTLKKPEGVRVLLDCRGVRAPMKQLYVNGQFVKNCLWAPYAADITDFIADGENTIAFKVFASNRNLLGPHHHIDGECYNVGPDSFTGVWSWVERKSEADATDIEDRSKSYWQDAYSFVEFGV